MTGSRRSPQSRSRPNDGAWGCISTSLTTTSRPMTSRRSWCACCDVFKIAPSLSWIDCKYIEVPVDGCWPGFPNASRLSGFRHTLPNSTLTNRYGTGRSTPTWPTSFPRMSELSVAPWLPRFAEHETNRHSCVPSSNTHSCACELTYFMNRQ